MQHPKGVLIERSKQLGLGKPSFSTRNSGPEHEPLFQSTVTVHGEVLGRGEGGTKRDAERRASEEALMALSRDRPTKNSEGPEPTPADPYDTAGVTAGATVDVSDEPFNGPWPIFAEVLAASLNVAHARINPTLTGPDVIDEVQALALQLYKGTLENLGEVVELDEAGEVLE